MRTDGGMERGVEGRWEKWGVQETESNIQNLGSAQAIRSTCKYGWLNLNNIHCLVNKVGVV